MSNSSHFITRISREAFNKKQDALSAEAGNLGDLNGTVRVPDRPGFVYVRLIGNRVVECFNNRVPAVRDLPVLIGFDPLSPNLYQVLSNRAGTTGAGNVPAENTFIVSPHHATHEWHGSDIVYVDMRQFLPFRVAPYSGLSVSVNRGIVVQLQTVYSVAAASINLSSFLPPYDGVGDQQSKFVLIVIRAGAFVVIDGTPVGLGDLTAADIPAFTPGDIPLAAVRLWTEQLAIIETLLDTDIVDLRFAALGYGDMLKSVYDANNDGIIDLAADVDIGGLATVTDPGAGDMLVLERAGIRYEFDVANLVTETTQQYRQLLWDVIGDDLDFLTEAGEALYELEYLE